MLPFCRAPLGFSLRNIRSCLLKLDDVTSFHPNGIILSRSAASLAGCGGMGMWGISGPQVSRWSGWVEGGFLWKKWRDPKFRDPGSPYLVEDDGLGCVIHHRFPQTQRSFRLPWNHSQVRSSPGSLIGWMISLKPLLGMISWVFFPPGNDHIYPDPYLKSVKRCFLKLLMFRTFPLNVGYLSRWIHVSCTFPAITLFHQLRAGHQQKSPKLSFENSFSKQPSQNHHFQVVLAVVDFGS